MRQLFFVLLILMLPLRGWSGDAMAVQMAIPAPMQQAYAPDVVGHMDPTADPAHVHAVAHPIMAAAHDCASHGDSDGLHPSDMAVCETCSLCQTCHTVAVLTLTAVPDHGRVPLAVPQRAAQGFTSADRALALKPPTA